MAMPTGYYPNSLTSNDQQAIQAAIKTYNSTNKSRVRMVRIKNTSEMAEIEVSESLLEEVRQSPYLEILSKL